tara:strand:- start:265 stop:750 length:486 start_codon:yes stop_codon:yes gene_type:complete
MAIFIVGCIGIVGFIFIFSVMLDCIVNTTTDLLACFRCFRSHCDNDTQPTTRNYWANMNLCDEYTEEIQKVNNLKDEKKQEITYLQSSLRKSTLRNRNQNVEYATEEDIQTAKEELQNVEQTLRKLRKCQYTYYLKTKEITREMNRRGMWELSKESHIENW